MTGDWGYLGLEAVYVPPLRAFRETLFDGYDLVIGEVSEDTDDKEGYGEEEDGHGVSPVGVGGRGLWELELGRGCSIIAGAMG